MSDSLFRSTLLLFELTAPSLLLVPLLLLFFFPIQEEKEEIKLLLILFLLSSYLPNRKEHRFTRYPLFVPRYLLSQR